MRTLACLLVAALTPALTVPAAAQNVMDEARRYYDSAAYEEALTSLAKADKTSKSQIIEVEQYRALCLIALGRMNDAEGAIAALATADPLYVPPASPKVLTFVSEVRRNVLPGVARRLLESGRTAYTQKSYDRAREDFQLLLQVLGDPAMNDKPETEDLRVLAEGFVQLLTATPPAAAPANRPTPAPAGPASPTPAPPTPAAIVPAVVIREVLPPWIPDKINANQEFAGAIRITIGVDGRVKSARIEKRSHPAYDTRLLQFARSWLYTPATLNGEPVEFERLIAIRLRPTQ